MEKRITKRDRYNQLMAIPAIAENADLVEFISHEIELLTRKTTGEKKPTKTQIENEALKSVILDTMEQSKSYSIADFMAFDGLNGLSCQKISGLVSKLVKSEKLTRSEVKGKPYFSLT